MPLKLFCFSLKKIIGTIVFCGRQGLALRGKEDSGPLKDEDASKRNPGNFRALLLARMEYDLELKSYMESASLNAQYTSPRIQNELITLCGGYVKVGPPPMPRSAILCRT